MSDNFFSVNKEDKILSDDTFDLFDQQRVLGILDLLSHKYTNEEHDRNPVESGVSADTGSDTSSVHFEDPRLAGFIDMISPEACSLYGLAIRNTLTQLFTHENDGIQTHTDIDAKDVRDADFGTGQISLQKADAERRVVALSPVHSKINLYARTDVPKKIFGLVDDVTEESLEASTYYIGLGTVSKDRLTNLFVPLLSSRAPNDCQLVLVEDDELRTPVNKPELVKHLRTIINNRGTYNTVQAESDAVELLQIIQEELKDSSQAFALDGFIDDLLDIKYPEADMSLAEGIATVLRDDETMTRIREKTGRTRVLLTADGELREMNLIGAAVEKEMNASSQGTQQIEYFFEDQGLRANQASGLTEHAYVLWGGMDPDEYGVKKSPQVALLRVTVDDFGRCAFEIPLGGSANSGNVLQDDTVEKDIERYVAILSEKLGYKYVRNDRNIFESGRLLPQELRPESKKRIPTRPRRRIRRSLTGIELPN